MIRLLVVDDSPLMRRLLGNIFSEEGGFEVEFARDGLEAIDKLHRFEPDVVTLDVHMPNMDGLACLDRIMIERPCPVVMVSARTDEGAAETLEALERGAVDFIPKPEGAVSLEIDSLAPRLVEKVRAAAGARLRPTLRLTERVRARSGIAAAARPRRIRSPAPAPATPLEIAELAPADRVVVVGTSTGGPQALDVLLSALPAAFPWPILIAQHMPSSFTGALARRLDRLCALDVVEVSAPVPITAGRIFIARGDADMIVVRRKGQPVAMSAPSDPDFRWHPSVDRLVRSAMGVFGADKLVGILMTGMGNDGATTMTEVRRGGGRTIAEADESAVVWGMPGELVKAGGAEFVTPLEAIAGRLIGLSA